MDDLRARMLPASRKLKEFEKERAERRKVRKRIKLAPTESAPAQKTGGSAEMADASAPSGGTSSTATAAAVVTETESTDKGKGKAVAEGELEEESVYRDREAAELASLVDASLKVDIGCSESGLYDLIGKSVL